MAEIEETTLAVPASGDIIKAAIERNGGVYEYRVVLINDMLSGGANAEKIEETLNLYGEMGWRLKDTIVNEIGRTLSPDDRSGVPATVQEQTLLVFERLRAL